MSEMTQDRGRGLATKAVKSRKTRFLQRELPTMIAVAALLAIWVGLVAGG